MSINGASVKDSLAVRLRTAGRRWRTNRRSPGLAASECHMHMYQHDEFMYLVAWGANQGRASLAAPRAAQSRGQALLPALAGTSMWPALHINHAWQLL